MQHLYEWQQKLPPLALVNHYARQRKITDVLTASSTVSADLPLRVVTSLASTVSDEPLHGAMKYSTTLTLSSTTSTNSPLRVVTSTNAPDDSAKEHTDTTEKSTPITASGSTTPLRVATGELEKPIENVQQIPAVEDKSTSEAREKPLHVVTHDSVSEETPTEDAAPTEDITVHDVVYEVLNAEQDDFVSISLSDINARTCSVNLDRLTNKDIMEITTYLKGDETKEDDDKCPSPKKKKRQSHRPGHKPSKDWIRAQMVISTRNKKIQKNVITLPDSKPTTSWEPVPATTPMLVEEAQADSDDTIIYEIPKETVATKKRHKTVAKFVFRTVGIKHYKDADTEQARTYTRKRNFKCTLCTKNYRGTRELNHHFRNTHGEIACIDCGVGFTSSLSSKKHSYIHKERKFACSSGEKTFAFNSQRDSHERTHMQSQQHPCTKPGYQSSFGRESDLKLHLAVHDSKPKKCRHCSYTNKDIRNVCQHERVHTDKTPYKCKICKKKFKFSMQKK